MAYQAKGKSNFTRKNTERKEALPEFKLIGKAMFACVYDTNLQKEKTFERKDGTTWTRLAQYKIDLVLDERALKYATEKLGFDERNIREPDDYQKNEVGYEGPFMTFSRLKTLPDGTEMRAPIVTDEFGDPMDDFIGNGSEVEVIFSRKEGKDFDKYGYNLFLKGVVVRDLIPFERKEKEEEVEEKPAAKKAPAKKNSKPSFDDDIPF